MTPKQTHDLEQAFASLALVAATAARYYAALITEGVPNDLAATLTLHMQAEMLKGARAMGDGAG